MPLYWRKNGDQFQIIIWKVEEEVEELLSQSSLSATETAQLNSFQSHYRKKEWLCTRIMLKLLYPDGEQNIVYDEFGKPHLQNRGNEISVSHTKDFVAL